MFILLQMQYSCLDFFSLADVPEIFAKITAGTASNVHLTMILVMTAGAMANKGELFVLDMGKPVRIYDLAKNMIRLSGFEPEVDIKIEEVGLRPGEKLYEELLMKDETLDKTDNNMIFIEKDAPYTRQQIEEKLQALSKVLKEVIL